METKELKITIPENHEIDWQESAKQEKIVFKKKDSKPRSWEEYCKQQQTNNKPGYYLNGESCRIQETSWDACYMQNEWKNVLPSEELAEAFLAMMQLISLRQAWIGNWKPDWNSREPCDVKYCITGKGSSDFEIEFLSIIRATLSFPTKEMAEDFMNCFKDLLEVARPLI